MYSLLWASSLGTTGATSEEGWRQPATVGTVDINLVSRHDFAQRRQTVGGVDGDHLVKWGKEALRESETGGGCGVKEAGVGVAGAEAGVEVTGVEVEVEFDVSRSLSGCWLQRCCCCQCRQCESPPYSGSHQ